MSRSEIFDNYIKVAMEQEMISEDASDKAKKKLEENPRADSLSPDDIKKLYKTKPNLPKGMGYKSNIVEKAHPNAVVLCPSYDRINGLVENLNERQNIILNIINKTPNGQVVQPKYAERDLILTLVRIANDLDNKNYDELRVLADTCLKQVSIKKQALFPAFLIPTAGTAVILIGSVIGLIYLYEHFTADEGFEKNSEKLLESINAILKAHDSISNTLGLGYEYSNSFLSSVSNLKTNVEEIIKEYKEVKETLVVLENIKTSEDVINVASKKNLVQKLTKEVENFKKTFNQNLNKLNILESKIGQNVFQNINIKEKGSLIEQIDKIPGLHGGYGLITNQFDDLKSNIKNYKESYDKTIKYLQEAEKIKVDSTSEIQKPQEIASKESKEPAKELAKEVSKSEDEEAKMKKYYEDMGRELADL